MTETRAIASPLAPYVPRMVREWLEQEDPSVTHMTVDGTAVFVDVSGFTSMSERMSRLGKAGAEEVTQIIGEAFSRLLDDAYRFGGTLVKFGGDALLLFFRDPNHHLRACAAAIAMRSSLRKTGVITTPVGKVQLRMSVGIHSGAFHFFLVGDSHRELVVAGPCATHVVNAESEANAGQIIVSSATASLLPRTNLGPIRENGRLLRGSIDAPEADVRFLSVDDDLSRFVPSLLREQVMTGVEQAAHRATVVAFIEATGLDALVDPMGLAGVADEIQKLVSRVQHAVDKRGITFLGTDVDKDGFKIILTAGAPISTGADEENMLLALREVATGNGALGIRVGVNRGRVFSGEIGTRFRRTYTVMGDAVNLAARVMSHAEIGQVLATPSVINGSRTLFATEAVEPFFVKGKKKAQEAEIVGAPTGSRSTIAASELPLIGRERELHDLLTAWDEARSGDGRAVELVAETGMGKSRLLGELVVAGEITNLMRSECRLYQASTPYFPFRSLLMSALDLGDVPRSDLQDRLSDLIAAKAPQLMPWLSLIGTVIDLEIPPSEQVRQLDDEFRRSRLDEAVAGLLEVVVQAPTLFLIDDAQWMDDASTDLMNHLIGTASSMPWLIVLNRRPDESGFAPAPEDSVIRIELRRLDPDKTRDLILEATKSTPLRTEQLEKLVEKSDGSPLLLIELLNALQRNEDVAEMPDSIEGLIQSRIDTLDPSDRDLLQRVSVLGASFECRHATSVLNLDDEEIEAAMQGVPDFISIDPNNRAHFKNALAHEVAYEGLPYRLRRQLHAQVAESIEAESVSAADEQSELLSIHFFEAGRWDESLEYSTKAGAKSDTVYANLEAATFYGRAVSSARKLEATSEEEIAGLLEARGDALERAGLFGEAIEAYGSALRYSSVPVRKADLMFKRARVRAFGGNYPAGLAELTKAVRVLDGDTSTEAQAARARAHSFRAVIRMMQGRSDDALDLATEALFEASDAGEQEALARSYMVLDAACLTLGRAAEGDYLPRALAMYEEMGDLLGAASAYNNMGERAWVEGRFEEAIDLYMKAAESWLRGGNDVEAATSRTNAAEVLIEQGRLGEAKEILDDALRVTQAHDSFTATSAEIMLGRVSLATGDTQTAIQRLTHAAETSEAMGHSEFLLLAKIHLASAYRQQGDAHRAERLLDEAEARIEQGGDIYMAVLTLVKAETLLDLGEPTDAASTVERGLDWAERLGQEHDWQQLQRLKKQIEGTGSSGNAEHSQTTPEVV